MAELECWNCGTSLDALPRPITRHNNCPKCFESLHCCRLCRQYRSRDTITCADERADPPVNKENANFCDFFRPAAGTYDSIIGVKEAGARKELSDLFGGEETSEDSADTPPATIDPDAAAKAKLEALFREDSNADAEDDQ